MAAINDLINQIENPELRQRIQQEVAKMSKQKKFGLVFEEHLPENTPLYDLPIRAGVRVAKKDGDIRDNYRVMSVKDGMAECVHLDDDHKVVSLHIDDIIAVAQFGEPIYPYLKPMDSICNAPDSELWHTLIEADNYHALQLLVYLYGGKVDCIYIDPPYNTGARDWKYNNDYVDSNDSYRHSKWLSFMKKRLQLAKKLLNPKDSVLIVTIDEKEYLHLGCLLEETFPEANIQMVTSVISGKGVSRDGQFSRVEEYLFFVSLGDMPILQLEKNMLNDSNKESNTKKNDIEFLGFRRRNKGNFRTSRPNQFYPVIVDNEDGHIVSIGDAITPDINRVDVEIPEGCTGLWPLDPSGSERIWSVVPETARILLEKGYLKVINWDSELRKGSVKYLADGMVQDIDNGVIVIDERDQYGAVISGHYANDEDNTLRPRRVWNDPTHNASSYGTLLIKKFLGEKRFDFPKSLYAVHDSIRFLIANKPNALILDFFAGSGTTLHAVNLMNKEDGGHRRCIMVTNNEIGEAKEKELKLEGIRPGDEEWEKWGIARYVTWPRTKCSIKGVDINGKAIDGDYVTSKMETKKSSRRFVQINFLSDSPTLKQKKALVSLIKKQKTVKLPTISEDTDFLLAEDDDSYNASILFNVEAIDDWKDALEGRDEITDLYVVTKKDALFRKIKVDVSELMGEIEESIPLTIPMADGFKANANFFKLGFLDKTAVSLGRQFKELLPVLWMKAGARGECPSLKTNKLPDMLICEKNHFAVLIDEKCFASFVEQVSDNDAIDMVYLVVDSDSMYREMARYFGNRQTCQLYRDYLDNFRINIIR